MQVMIEILQSVGVFVAGVLVRFGVFLAILLVLVIPAVAIALAVRAVSERRRRALGIRRVAGLLFRPDLFYAPGHTWLGPRRERRWSWMKPHRNERVAKHREAMRLGLTGRDPEPEWPPAKTAGTLELGIDDLAQRLLPSVTAVELPRPGTTVVRGETIAALHGGSRVVRIPSPIDGTVAGVNAAVLRDPGLVKRDGYCRGWLVAVAPSDPSFADLPRGEQAESWLRRESARYGRFVEERLGFAAADGGELLAPAPWLVGEEGWKELTAAFLRA